MLQTCGAGTAAMSERFMNKGWGSTSSQCCGAWLRKGRARVGQSDFPEVTFLEEGACKITRQACRITWQRCRQRRSHAASFWAPQVPPESASALVRDC